MHAPPAASGGTRRFSPEFGHHFASGYSFRQSVTVTAMGTVNQIFWLQIRTDTDRDRLLSDV